MIKPGEIKIKAGHYSVRDQQIEKDYILTWLLIGIAIHDQLSKVLIFKGGTVLKKVYFEEYRFSEDLDFTLLQDSIENEQIFEWFNKVFNDVKEHTNIQLEMVSNNEHADGGINFYVQYMGPLGGSGSKRKVKVDISRSEKMEFHPISKPIFVNYSDQLAAEVLCYSLEEVLIEKMRSIMQRSQPRDFYDFWYLLEINGMDMDHFSIEFNNKCNSKGLNALNFHQIMFEKIPHYKASWKGSMKDQIKDLPEFDEVVRALKKHFRK